MKPNPLTNDKKPTHLPHSDHETQKNGSYEVNLSAQFEDLEETTETKKSQNEQKPHQKEEPEIKHYIIPGTMFEGQFQYVTKQNKQQDVQQQLEELENEKRQIQISTEHYIIPTTVVEAQVQKGGKLQKSEEVQKQLNRISKEHQQDQPINESERPKVLHRVNRHEFNSNQVPELHEQDIPLNLQPVEVNQSLYEAIDDPKIKSIKPLQPVKLQTNKIEDSSLPNLTPLNLDHPLQSVQKQDKEQEKKQKDEQRHYIIPGTCFQGQFQYVTKEKKEEDVERQLRELDDEKRQLKINTQHYVNPTTVVEGQVPDAQKQRKPQFTTDQAQQTQKKQIPKRSPKDVSNKQNQLKNSKTHKYRESDRSSFMKTQYSQADTEGLKLLKGKSKDNKFIRMQIQSNQQEKLPYKIDQYTCMTVLSPQQQERPTLNFPFSEEPNDDLEIIVIQTSLNKEATSLKDLVNQRPKDVLGNQKMQSVIQGIKNRDGSPVKVVIGTKQFANYPGQSAPSPPIIDETTLSNFRKKNNSQFLQKNNQFDQWEAYYSEEKKEEEGNPEEMEISKMNVKEKTAQITDGKQEYRVQHLHVTLDVDKIRKQDKKGKKPKSIFHKILKSAVFSSMVGGLAWLTFEDKKITAISAATGFAVAMMIQK